MRVISILHSTSTSRKKIDDTIVLFSYDATGSKWIFPSHCNETFGALFTKFIVNMFIFALQERKCKDFLTRVTTQGGHRSERECNTTHM